MDQLESAYDVVVVGGGAAGLNAGLMLGRARRSVLVVDAGTPRNAPADAVHGLFAREGTRPAELLERGRHEVRTYGGEVVAGEVVTVERAGDGFAIGLADGRETRARRLLVTSGLVDELPDVPGLRERWGRDVVHCPYCHGWEVRDRAIGVVGSNPMAVHGALLWRQWSDDVVLFRHTAPDLTDDQAEQLAARGVRVVEEPIAEVVVENDRIVGVRLADGQVVAREILAVGTRMVARAGFLAGLGLVPEEHPTGMGEFVPADPMGRSSVPGVWLAGNVTELHAQVGAAAAGGAFAAAQLNMDLVADDTARAVELRRRQLLADA
ncbi:NAD(P)/FAD-dependent oxidoreductase [Nocardioides bigeumensis]|uniref:NAD(P)/FAD-dependent oxidoreductase n=1 Tax=Nocardioides bigeumensis TaxID=433657 RepID=A0ABN2YK13_9ACTN